MARTARIVQTPGEQPADVLQLVEDEAHAGESESDELARLRAENAKLKAASAERAERDALIAATDSAAMSERLISNKPVRGLQPEDVDPTKIKRAVLTEKGWVCPVESPASR
jgi:hypothetical protein